MKVIKLELTTEEYHDLMDLLENAVYCDYPFINGKIAEIILKKIEDD